MKRKLIVMTLLALTTINVHSQTFPGVTEGDGAVTYVLYSQSQVTYAYVYAIDNSAIGSDGVLELPEYVTYDGTEYPVVFCNTGPSLSLNYLTAPLSAIKIIILHGMFTSGMNVPVNFNVIFPNLEEIVMEKPYNGFSTSDGVLYKEDGGSSLESIAMVPTQWNPEGKILFQPETKKILLYAFRNVQFLGNMGVFEIPDQIEAIGRSAFMESAIKGVKLPENSNYTEIAQACFDVCKNLTQVIIPDNVITIGMAAFRECTTLPYINLNKVEVIQKLAFYGDTSLAIVESPENLTSLGRCSFYNCIRLSSIDLEQTSIKIIPAYCFWKCSDLTEINLPQTLTQIDTYAFNNVSKLSNLVLPESLEEIGANALPWLRNGSTQSLYIGKNVKNMTGLSLYTVQCNIEIDPDNPYFIKEDDVIYSKDKEELVYYLANYSRKSFMVPSSVKKICDGAFYLNYNNSVLEHITLPSSCEAIGYQSFYGSSIKRLSVTVPPSVKVISGKSLKEYRYSRNRTDTGGSVANYYSFVNIDVYLMGSNLEEIECNVYMLSNSFTPSVKIYITKTAYNSINTQMKVWSNLLSKGRLSTDVPVTLSSTGLSTMCRDFDVDLSETDGLEAYVAASFETPMNGGDGEINMQKVSTGNYVPSRVGVDNYEFHGVVLKGEPGASYTYRIGEQDYLSGAQTILSDEQNAGNMLVGAPVHRYIDKTDGDMTNFVLKNGWFRYVSSYGELAWNKAYLQVPTASIQTEGGNAKNIRFVFADSDSETTGISSQVIQDENDTDDAPYYNLNGMRIDNPQKGIYIRNNRKVVIR